MPRTRVAPRCVSRAIGQHSGKVSRFLVRPRLGTVARLPLGLRFDLRLHGHDYGLLGVRPCLDLLLRPHRFDVQQRQLPHRHHGCIGREARATLCVRLVKATQGVTSLRRPRLGRSRLASSALQGGEGGVTPLILAPILLLRCCRREGKLGAQHAIGASQAGPIAAPKPFAAEACAGSDHLRVRGEHHVGARVGGALRLLGHVHPRQPLHDHHQALDLRPIRRRLHLLAKAGDDAHERAWLRLGLGLDLG
eukprot:scaffold49761_cov48-Phaeocystis_antarctica.AAC.1